MPVSGSYPRCAFATFSVVAIAFTGCQSPDGPWSSHSASSGDSSFDVSMAAVTESDFSHNHQFYYYAATGIYRDCDESRWFWSEDGGRTWISGADLPEQFDPGDEIPFAVSLTLNDPAMEHPAIAAAYPATGALSPATATVQGPGDFEN